MAHEMMAGQLVPGQGRGGRFELVWKLVLHLAVNTTPSAKTHLHQTHGHGDEGHLTAVLHLLCLALEGGGEDLHRGGAPRRTYHECDPPRV